MINHGKKMSGRLVRDINPSGSSSPDNLVAVNGLIYFSADLGTTESDSPASPAPIEPSDENDDSDNAIDIINVEPEKSLGSGTGLIRSDGSSDGTILLKTFESIDSLTPFGDSLFFIANDGNGYELWKSDGTVRGTKKERVLFPKGTDQEFPPSLFEIDGTLFYSAIDSPEGKYPYDNGYELWRWTGEGVGQRFFRNLIPDRSIVSIKDGLVTTEIWNNDSFADNFTEIQGNFFFTAWSSSLYTLDTRDSAPIIGGLELYYSDGTESGTKPINVNKQTYSFYAPEDREYARLPAETEHMGVTVCHPFSSVRKDWIIRQYVNQEIGELLEITRSCEGEFEGLDYKTYKPYQPVPYCNECFWCKEREWGIANASK